MTLLDIFVGYELRRRAFFVQGKMPNPPEQPFPTLSWFFKGPAHLAYSITLNLTISVSRHNVENLIGNFGAIHVGMMRAKFQASSFTGMRGE